VEVVEFFRVWALVQQGRVRGLSATSAFDQLGDKQRRKQAAFSAGFQGDAALRAQFKAATAGSNQSGGLAQPEFVALVQALLAPMSRADGKPPPSAKDLAACFAVADEDKTNIVNEDEFVKIMNLVKTGKVNGLGHGAVFSSKGALSVRASGFKGGLAIAPGFAIGDAVKVKAAFAAKLGVGAGALGVVLAAHSDGDVDALIGLPGAQVVLTLGEEQLALVERAWRALPAAASIHKVEDGFRGTYDEVLAHEEKLNIAKGHEVAVDKNGYTVMHPYEVSRSNMDRPYSVALHVRFRLRLIIFCVLFFFFESPHCSQLLDSM
jgi:hypothetical protein